jgi:hypothetical protein
MGHFLREKPRTRRIIGRYASKYGSQRRVASPHLRHSSSPSSPMCSLTQKWWKTAEHEPRLHRRDTPSSATPQYAHLFVVRPTRALANCNGRSAEGWTLANCATIGVSSPSSSSPSGFPRISSAWSSGPLEDPQRILVCRARLLPSRAQGR